MIINQVSFVDFKSFKSKKENVHSIREISDNLCAEHCLSIIRNPDLNKQRKDPKHSRSEFKYSMFKHKTNGQVRPIRMERLGAAYAKSMINFRINNEFVDIKKHNYSYNAHSNSGYCSIIT